MSYARAHERLGTGVERVTRVLVAQRRDAEGQACNAEDPSDRFSGTRPRRPRRRTHTTARAPRTTRRRHPRRVIAQRSPGTRHEDHQRADRERRADRSPRECRFAPEPTLRVGCRRQRPSRAHAADSGLIASSATGSVGDSLFMTTFIIQGSSDHLDEKPVALTVRRQHAAPTRHRRAERNLARRFRAPLRRRPPLHAV